MDNFKWSRELIKNLIFQIEKRENLYNFSHPDYRNKIKREQSIYRIVEELKRLNPRVTREIVKTKFHSLRTQFQKQCRTLAAEERKKNTTSDEGRYSPTLWCFRELSFLKNHTSSRASVTEKQEKTDASITLKPISSLAATTVPVSLSSSVSVSTASPALQITPSLPAAPRLATSLPPAPQITPSLSPAPPRPTQPLPPQPEATSQHLFAVPSASAPQIIYTPPLKKLKLSSSLNRDREIHMCATCPCIEAQESEYDKIGKTWGSELSKMTAEQQIYAKRAIAEILFEGQLGTLHRNSVIISHVEALYDSPHHDHPKTEQIDECF